MHVRRQITASPFGMSRINQSIIQSSNIYTVYDDLEYIPSSSSSTLFQQLFIQGPNNKTEVIVIHNFTMSLNHDYTFETNPEVQIDSMDDDGTSVSNMSDSSEVEPSFFIIPPRDLSTSVRHRRRAQPWERKNGDGNDGGNNDNLSITSSASIFPETAYRRDRLMKDIDSAQNHGAEGYASILKTLKQAGIMIFIVDSKVSSTVSEVLESIQNVILHSRKVQRTNQLINEIGDKKDGKICGGGKGSTAMIINVKEIRQFAMHSLRINGVFYTVMRKVDYST